MNLKGINVGPICAYLAKCDVDFEKSPLFNSETETTYVDEERRLSQYRSIKDPSLFALVEEFVMTTLNQGDEQYSYVLWKDGSDVTEIRYSAGGFFKPHRDFTSMVSNMVEEFSCIICVTPEKEFTKGVEGGQTAVWSFGGLDSSPTAKSFNTTTPGSGVVFRKDLNHEGKMLLKGTKHIITINLLGVRKNSSDQVLYVTFPDATDNGAASSASDAIEQAALGDRSFAIPVSKLTGPLEAHVRWANNNAEANGEHPPPVVPFVCKDFSPDDFSAVAKILNRCYLDEDCIKRAWDCLEYFGPFNCENILVDLALDSDLTPDELGKSAKKPKVAEEFTPKSPRCSQHDANVIVCENEARMQAVLSVARAFNEPYVPFKILFVEGMMHFFDGDGGGFNQEGPIKVQMTPAATFIGEHNNVMSLWCLDQGQYGGREEPFSIEEAHNCTPYFDCLIDQDMSKSILDLPFGSEAYLFEYDGDYPDEAFEVNFGGESETFKLDIEQFISGGFGLGLNLKVNSEELQSSLLKYLFNKHDRADVTPLELQAGLSNDKSGAASDKYFHLDSEGKVRFTRSQAAESSAFIASLGLEEKIKARLQEKQFELPQVSEKVSMVYCNDHRYGKMNVLWVCGVIRLDDAAQGKQKMEDTAAGTEFDAWPSEESRKKTQDAFLLAKKYEDHCNSGDGMKLGDKWWDYDSDISISDA